MSAEAAKDLGRHLQAEIGRVVDRQTRIAGVVCDPAEVAMMLVEAAIGLSISAAATTASMAKPGVDRADLARTVLERIARTITGTKAQARIAEAVAAGRGDIL